MKDTNNSKDRLGVSSTDLARHFSDYLAQVRYGGRTIVVEKNHTPIAELRPLEESSCTLKEFLSLWETLPRDATFADDLDLVNDSDQPPENPWA